MYKKVVDVRDPDRHLSPTKEMFRLNQLSSWNSIKEGKKTWERENIWEDVIHERANVEDNAETDEEERQRIEKKTGKKEGEASLCENVRRERRRRTESFENGKDDPLATRDIDRERRGRRR